MNNNYLFKKLAGIFLLLLFCYGTSNAQTGRFPTKEEIAIKKNLENIYKSSPLKAFGNNPGHLMVTGPEQDCDNAIPVCQQSYTQSNSYTGSGSTQEVSGTCLSTQETNSVWYTFTVQNSGTFTFMLNTANDYDFALYDITTIGCAGVPSATPVRCNFSATYGNTGLTLPTSATIPIGISASGVPTMAGLNVVAGQTFALIIDNFSANSNGYTLTFGGTAQIYDNIPPTFGTLTHACNSNNLKLTFSEPVQCGSIATNGSDFTITGPGAINVPVLSASGNLCSTGASFTSFATLNFNSTGLPTGVYTVSLSTGTDGNTILDKCGNSMSIPQTATFTIFAPISISATNTIVCSGGATTLNISGLNGVTGVTYSWAPIAGTYDSLNINPTSTNTYIGTATYGGCSQSVSLAITVSQPPVVSVNPSNVSLCSGTTNIVASATMNGSACTNCNYVWSGSSTQTDNGVPNSTITGAGAGTYSVTVSSNTGCLGNSSISNVSILSPSSPPSCDIIYVSPAGGGSGLVPASPTTIQTALTMAACNSIVIKMQIGDYPISNPLSVTSFVTIEGGYNVGFTLKTSAKATVGGFPAQGTRIIRNTSNVEGTAGYLRLTAFNITSGSSYFRLQDIRIDMPDNAAGTAISNYGVYLGNGCSNYNIVRCYIYSGNAGSGTSGSAGVIGSTGTTGGAGGAGGNGWSGTMGDGGAEAAGAGSTHSSMFWDFMGGASNGASLITAEAANGGTRNGGEGGAGGSGGYYSEDGGNGSPGGAGGNGAAGGVPPANSGGWYDCGWYSSMDGFNGNAGTLGGTGTIGSVGPVGTDVSGYWQTGSQGGAGGNGYGGGGGSGAGGGGGDGSGFLCFNTNGTGGGGGAGGGGGQGGTGGTGGFGGGSTYGIFIFNNGANSNVIDCQIINGIAGAGGTGGTGGTGGNGGNGGARGCGDACTTSGEGNGGVGGAGGKGGTGGTGGTGSAGVAVQVKTLGGVALVQNTSINMLTQPIITVDNIACTNVSINHNTTTGSPAWTSFGSGATPASGTGSPAATQYSSLGRKDIVMNANPYSGFNNIIVTAPSSGTILASTTSLCPGVAQFSASVAGTPGFSYLWSVLPSATITTPSLDNTSITFSNSGSTAITYTVTLTVSSQCCGALTPITQTVTVNPIPAAPVASANPICLGGIATFTATAPSGASFTWYDAASSGNLLGIGTTFTTPNLLTASAYTVYLQATNNGGCSSTITPVSITPTAIQPPAPVSVTSCDIGIVFVNIAPVAGVTNYNWYSDIAGTILMQSGSSLSYGQNIATTGGSYTIYVQSNVAGCTPSSLVALTGNVSANPITLSQSFSPNDTVCINTPVTVTLTPSGGNGTFTYNWSPVVSSSNTITQTLTASTSYYVTITSNGCSKLFNLPIIVKPYPFDSIAPTSSITCASSTVTLDGSSSAAGTDISYGWTTVGGNITSGISSNIATVNASGNYTLTVTDITSGCSSTQSITVNSNNTLPSVTASSNNNISCITPSATLTGSSSGNAIVWNGGTLVNSSNPATVSTAGTYTLTVTDAGNGCTTIDSVTITGNTTPPIVSASSNNNISCISPSSTLTGTSAGNTIIWNGGLLVNAANPATVTSAGTYTLTVTAATNGCTTIDSVTITGNTLPPTLSVSSNNITCSTPSATLTGTSAGSTMVWNGGTLVNVTNPASVTSAGTYTVTATNSVNGCTSIDSVTVTSNTTPPTITATSNNNISCTTPNATLTGVSAGNTIVWNGGTLVNAANPASVSTSGTFTVTATDAANGCTNTASVIVTSNTTPPNVNAGLDTTLNCVVTSIVLNGSSTTSGVNYSWSGPGIVSGNTTATPTINAAGNYTLTVTNPLNGCTANDIVSVTNSSLPIASFSANPLTGAPPLTVDFTNGSQNANTFYWTFGDNQFSTLTNPSDIYTTPGTYNVILIASFNNQCPDTAEVVITIFDNYTLMIPNVFTPDGDGTNDLFFITSKGVESLDASIFDRWGLKIFEWNSVNGGWNGRSNAGVISPDGTYYYIIKVKPLDPTKGEETHTGYLQLIRK